MTELVLLLSMAALGAAVLLAWMMNPWRGLIGWVCMLSVQLPYRLFFELRPALSDLFLPSLALGLLLSNSRPCLAPLKERSLLSTLVIVFAVFFLIVGNTMTYFELRTIPEWTWLNKDIGLLDLMLCYFVFLRLVDTRENLESIVRAFVLSGSAINLLAVLGGIARYVFGIPNMMMREGGSLRLVGLNINPSSYGGFILCVLLLQFALLIGGSKLLGLSQRAQYLNLGLLGMACLMTQSRSSFLGLVVGMMALLGFFRAKASMRLVGVALMILLATHAVVHWYTASPGTSSEFWNVELSSRTIDTRIDTNAAALNMYLDSATSALVGIGVGTFYTLGPQLLGNHLIIHNDFLWLLVELGPLGLLLFCAIFVVSLQSCIMAARALVSESHIAIGVACSIIGTLAWMIGTEGLWHRHVWFLLALSEACHRLCRAEATPGLSPPSRWMGTRFQASLSEAGSRGALV